MDKVEKYRCKRYNRLARRAGLRPIRMDDWDESKHDRDENGQFAPKGGGSSSSDVGNETGKSSGSGGSSSSAPVITKSKYRQKRNALCEKLKDKPDGTYDLETGKPLNFDNGYQVSFQTSISEDPDDDGFVSDEDYDKTVEDLMKQTGSKAYVGKFDVPEVSFHCESYEQAMKIAGKYNQMSILNWEMLNTYAGVEWDDDIQRKIFPRNPQYDPSKNHVKGE